MLWPNILEAVKNRRRFTWILLSQNAQVAGFDGTTLQLGFVNAGARDNFLSSGSEDVLRQALGEQFNVQWKIEAIVDPSGGSAPQAPGGPSGFGGGQGGHGGTGGGAGGHNTGGGYSSGGGGGYSTGGGSGGTATAQRPAPSQSTAPSTPAQQSNTPSPAATSTSAPASSAPVPQPSAPRPRSVSVEDDIPEDDDPDLDESALSGQELIVRELGATVVEEFSNGTSSAWSGRLWWCVSSWLGVALGVCDSGRDRLGAW